MSVLCVHCCRDASMLGLMASSLVRKLPCRLRKGSRASWCVCAGQSHQLHEQCGKQCYEQQITPHLGRCTTERSDTW